MSERPPQAGLPASPPPAARQASALGPQRPRRRRTQPPERPGGRAWRERRLTSFGMSAGLHALVLLALLGLPLPAAAPDQAKKPVEVIEVDFVEVPAVKPAKAAAPPPVEREDPKPIAQAPVRPMTPPRPDPARAPKPAPPRQAPAKAAPRAPIVPQEVNRLPVPRRETAAAELARKLAARRRQSLEDEAAKLKGLNAGNDAADPGAAPQRPAGRPVTSHSLPQGELSGRGILAAPEPRYPEAARARGLQGTVMVRIRVGPEGNVVGVSVENSATPQLDAAAEAAAWRYRFTPLGEGDTQIQSSVIPFHFQLY